MDPALMNPAPFLSLALNNFHYHTSSHLGKCPANRGGVLSFHKNCFRSDGSYPLPPK